MLGFGFPEVGGWHNLCHDFAGPQAGCVDVGDRVLGDQPLFIGRIEDGRSIARAEMGALAMERSRVVYPKGELESLSIAELGGIDVDRGGLRMPAVIAVGRGGRVAARVAAARRETAVVTAEQVLDTPETTAGKYCTL